MYDEIDRDSENEYADDYVDEYCEFYDPIIKQIIKLYANPIIGSYDIEHLKNIHDYIFKYAESNEGKHDEKPYNAGSFRSESNFWVKDRLNESYLESTIFYSSMNENNIKELKNILSDIDVKRLSRLKEKDFAKEIASIYAKLDYIHPFKEGNSRTLREFTRTLSLECGFNLDWEKIQDPYDIYIARDLAVNEIAVTKSSSPKIRENMEKFSSKHVHDKNLSEIISTCLSKFSEQEYYFYKKMFSHAREADTRGERD